ncbi:hypothetical protein [Vibrio cholerae]|uniref:hypothetical protein n=1 Tax=Vibrio cholerae TaxID=666 RepID=UPI000BA962B9|nr:hypothetical protein [Vibrio cholerae]PAS27429.1 hypothetical protein CGT71_18085 [Vibrio cholerae]
MLDYKETIHPSSVLIIFYDEVESERTINNAKKVCNNYGLRLIIPQSFPELIARMKESEFSITHSIIRLRSRFNSGILDEVRSARSKGYTSSSLAFSYNSIEDANKYENDINIQKEIKGSLECINIMRPDTYVDGLYLVSELKLLDNIICDTIRLKYKTECISNYALTDELPNVVKDYFISCSHIYGDLRMYHRSDTDGYFAMRHDGKIYITATKSPKGRGLDLDRIICLESYDRETNTITYSGAYLPSSDAVEAYVVFDSLDEVQQLIHTHDSKRFTRNKDADIFPSIGVFPYGEPELGDRITSLYKKTKSPLIVMKEHGEVFFGTHNCSAIKSIISSISKVGLKYKEEAVNEI